MGHVLGFLAGFTGTVGVVSAYANLVSYYGTKFKLNRLAKRYGQDYAKEVFDRTCDAYEPPMSNFIGGFGIKLLKKKYVF